MQARSIGELIAASESGPVKYLPFWGHQPRPDGEIGASYLSQWWPVQFTVDGVVFATAEHYMMWRKALLFDDYDIAEKIVAAAHPGAAKKLGRSIRGFADETWAEHRFGIVVSGNLAKFGQHEQLCRFLLNTGSRVLVEASPVDRIWGVGMTADDPRIENPADWQGLNLLGFALMETREKLRG
ncbi:NADAR family protein [Nocardia flavorosea]|uniref:NADAR family protein n=1 Tax=Nocardia flavorosea TaxID=53429 RepID=A0A846YHZ2_9NOCA|nr:NADAR family protein [Nocardia flavorosea]NKY58523.1 NADAR family protein [Nocardia flavorosea]